MEGELPVAGRDGGGVAEEAAAGASAPFDSADLLVGHGAGMLDRPVAVPRRRGAGCGSGAGTGVGAAASLNGGRLPRWLTVKLPGKGEYAGTRSLLRGYGLHTVCEEARCPNLSHCWERGTATVMILGEICTRRCGFCAVTSGRPQGIVDRDEPRRVGEAVARMGLRHTVITSVARDDLKDGGSVIFAQVIREIRARSATAIEVLIPDFRGHAEDLRRVIEARPDVVNHNVETVERLHPVVRPSARYHRSLELLRRVTEWGEGIKSKSGIMLGLGETGAEVATTLRDLRAHGCDLLTIGQYLRPSQEHLPVVEYVTPGKFAWWGEQARALGFESVASGPLVRSSFHAGELAGTVRRGEAINAVG